MFEGLEVDIYDAEGSAKGCGPYDLSGSVGGFGEDVCSGCIGLLMVSGIAIHHHHIVPATALIHRTARPSISAMSSLLGISPKCVQLVMIWFRSHVAAPHIQCLFSR